MNSSKQDLIPDTYLSKLKNYSSLTNLKDPQVSSVPDSQETRHSRSSLDVRQDNPQPKYPKNVFSHQKQRKFNLKTKSISKFSNSKVETDSFNIASLVKDDHAKDNKSDIEAA